GEAQAGTAAGDGGVDPANPCRPGHGVPGLRGVDRGVDPDVAEQADVVGLRAAALDDRERGLRAAQQRYVRTDLDRNGHGGRVAVRVLQAGAVVDLHGDGAGTGVGT